MCALVRPYEQCKLLSVAAWCWCRVWEKLHPCVFEEKPAGSHHSLARSKRLLLEYCSTRHRSTFFTLVHFFLRFLHKCVQEGFEVTHDERVITLFSASRYCGKCTNKGAYLIMTSNMGVELQQYYSHSMEDIRFQVKAIATTGCPVSPQLRGDART